MPPDPYAGPQGQDVVGAQAQVASALCDQCSGYAVKINPDGSGKCLLCGYFYNYYDTGEDSYQSDTEGHDPGPAYPQPPRQEADDDFLPPPPGFPSQEQPPPPLLSSVAEPEPVEERPIEEETDEGKVNVRIIKSVETEDGAGTSYCNECGAQVESGWNVCIHCGSKLI